MRFLETDEEEGAGRGAGRAGGRGGADADPRALPLAIGGRVAAGRLLHCGFCDHAAPAREFVAEDVYDTLGNEVYLIARVA